MLLEREEEGWMRCSRGQQELGDLLSGVCLRGDENRVGLMSLIGCGKFTLARNSFNNGRRRPDDLALGARR